jgi:hypothetical protein
MNQSVMVIERKDVLGGNTQTFTDPATGIKADIGVEEWHNVDIVTNFFARLNVSLTIDPVASSGVEFIDFATGEQLNGYPGNQGNTTAALQGYAAQLAKYPFLDNGFDLPDPVPTDLLMPFGKFIEKYDLSPAMVVLTDFAQGLGNFTNYPTLYAMKLMGLSILDGVASGFLTTTNHDNSEIYRNAQAVLLETGSLLLNSHVVSADRNCDDELVRLVVSTPSGHKVIEAKKIIIAIPPTLNNLHSFHLDFKERSLFEQFKATGYYTGLLRNSGLPLSLLSRGSNTEFNVPGLPQIYSTEVSTIPGLQHVFYGSDTILPIDEVRSNIISTVQRFLPNTTSTAPPEFAVLSNHSPFVLTVPSSAIEKGFYRDLNNLQGYRNTYYTGGTFQTQDSTLIWQFTEALLSRVVA